MEVDPEHLTSVRSGLLVVESEGVHELVDDGRSGEAAGGVQGHVLGASAKRHAELKMRLFRKGQLRKWWQVFLLLNNFRAEIKMKISYSKN